MSRYMKRFPAQSIVVGLALILTAWVMACSRSVPETQAKQVTIYVSTDRVFSEPVLRAYEQRTGIKVNDVYDTEETKTTGLANRLLAEANRPRADVFWANEPVRTLVLKKRGVLAPYRSPQADGMSATFRDPDGYWTAFSARLRVIAYNTKLVRAENAPHGIEDLVLPKWRGQVAIADPRFGSTSFHVAAVYAVWGDQKADDFFRRLKANQVRIAPSNSAVLDLVARGEVKVGLTDTDDVNVALEAGRPVAMVLPDREGMGVPVFPNMVSLIAGAPNTDEGKKLIDYLLCADVEQVLAQSEAVQIPLRPGVAPPKRIPALETFKPMTLDYAKAADLVEHVTQRLQTILGL